MAIARSPAAFPFVSAPFVSACSRIAGRTRLHLADRMLVASSLVRRSQGKSRNVPWTGSAPHEPELCLLEPRSPGDACHVRLGGGTAFRRSVAGVEISIPSDGDSENLWGLSSRGVSVCTVSSGQGQPPLYHASAAVCCCKACQQGSCCQARVGLVAWVRRTWCASRMYR